ncbi:hypothetical protein PFISCL1PPCAC_11566, partial [Pristionchus fissidentatus]
ELRCVRCDEYATHSLAGYMLHLRLKHDTTANKEGLIFRCACGNERNMRKHFTHNKCPGAKVTIMRKDTVNRKGTESPVTRLHKRAKLDEDIDGIIYKSIDRDEEKEKRQNKKTRPNH